MQKNSTAATGPALLSSHLLSSFLSSPLCFQVRTHLRNMVIIPEMIGSVVGVYNGKTFNQVRAKQWQRAMR